MNSLRGFSLKSIDAAMREYPQETKEIEKNLLKIVARYKSALSAIALSMKTFAEIKQQEEFESYKNVLESKFIDYSMVQLEHSQEIERICFQVSLIFTPEFGREMNEYFSKSFSNIPPNLSESLCDLKKPVAIDDQMKERVIALSNHLIEVYKELSFDNLSKLAIKIFPSLGGFTPEEKLHIIRKKIFNARHIVALHLKKADERINQPSSSAIGAYLSGVIFSLRSLKSIVDNIQIIITNEDDPKALNNADKEIDEVMLLVDECLTGPTGDRAIEEYRSVDL